MVSSIELQVENEVTRKETNSFLTGFFSDQDILGWTYDKRRLTDLQNNESRYLTTLGGHGAGLLNGFLQEDWISGVVDGIEYQETLAQRNHNSIIWTPVYKVGSFAIFSELRKLYSDYSCSGNFAEEDDVNGLNHIELHSDARQNSISCALYKRDTDGIIYAEIPFSYVDSFTGDLVSGERLETEDEDGNILVNNLSRRHNEFIIRDQEVYLSGNFRTAVGLGDESNTNDEIIASWEPHLPVAGGFIFLRYINPYHVIVAVIQEDDSVVFLERVDTLDFIEEGTAAYTIDKDLGVLAISGREANPITLSEDIDALSDELLCFYDNDFIDLPERGVVEIESERIAYTSKGLTSLLGLTRGYEGTTATSHARGRRASFVTRGTFIEGAYYIRYTALPRIDYEVTSYEYRRANRTNWLNVHPLANLRSNSIIQLRSQTINLAEIVLTTNEPLIGGNLYGPVYFGTDVARLVATAYDASGNPVEDIEITIEKLYGPGMINGSETLMESESNSSGEVYGFYNAPYEEADVLLDVSDITYDGADTLIVIPNLPSGVVSTDIYLFQVLKHDPTQGTVGKKVKAVAGGTATEPWGLVYLDCRLEFTEDFNEGTLQIVYDSVRYTFAIRHAMQINVFGEEPLTRLYLDSFETFLTDSPFDESTVWLIQEEAEIWDSVLQRGAQVIVYEWSLGYEHPLTHEEGAYGPLRPDTISGTTLRYIGRHLPVPAPDDDDENLGAYKVIAPAEARFIAYGRDPYSGSTIESNEIRFRLALPNTLSGVDSSGVLPIPYGFTFVTDDFNVGAGLGGSNFITINPAASGINQFTLRGSF